MYKLEQLSDAGQEQVRWFMQARLHGGNQDRCIASAIKHMGKAVALREHTPSASATRKDWRLLEMEARLRRLENDNVAPARSSKSSSKGSVRSGATTRRRPSMLEDDRPARQRVQSAINALAKEIRRL